MGLLKPNGLGLCSGSCWAHSLGQKGTTDLKIWLVFRYRDLSLADQFPADASQRQTEDGLTCRLAGVKVQEV